MMATALLDVLRPPSRLVSLLPVVACVAFLLLILASGAPSAPPDAERAWRTLQDIGIGPIALLILGLIVVALLLDPLQLRLVRLLEGDWPSSLAGVSRRSIKRQRTHRDRLVLSTLLGDSPGPRDVQRVGTAAAALRRRFARDDKPPRPTALGNALAAMEDRAGLQYGWDAVVAWPRLYPLLSPGVRSVVDGQRERLDTLARLSVCSTVTTVLASALLYASGWWILLAALPAAIARTAYIGTVHTAVAYGKAVEVAFDLHRFDLLRHLHLPFPRTLQEERVLSDQVCLVWRQGVDLACRYEHRDGADGPVDGTGAQPGTGSPSS
ncbi:hypothetical protein AB0I82_13845 [Streptomyces sp. NPDC050315]|uniref:hypothetical protein n=1 Tax=Streptomyces sp. NPDC050315 TaxID=3155039 RepID=UPI003427D117